MKTTFQYTCALLVLIAGIHQAAAQGTAFTYQGRLNSGTNIANGSYDMSFGLFTVSAGGSVLPGNLVTNTSVTVSNGLFTTSVDFGITQFTIGQPRWLELAVSPHTSNTFNTLAPRQQVQPTPFALYAESMSTAGLIGQVVDNNLSASFTSPHSFLNYGSFFDGTFSGNGASLSNLNASQLTTGTVADARLSANVALRAGGNAFSGQQTVTSGKVGIGTSSPLAPLEVRNTSGDNLILSGPGGAEWSAYDSTASADLWDFTANTTGFGIALPGATPSIFIDANNGSVGIATTSPQTVLQIGDPTDNGYAGMIGLVSVSGDASISRTWDIGVPMTGDDVSGDGYSFVINDVQSGQTPEFMIKYGTGNVAIGGTNPVASVGYPSNWNGLHTLAPNAGINLIEGATQSRLHLRTDNNITNVSQDFIIDNFANQINFRWLAAGLANYPAAMTIATNSNIGIGTTTPNSTLAVVGNIYMGKQRPNTTFNQIGDTIYLGAEQKYLANTLGTPLDGSTDWINLMANSLSAGIVFGLSTSTANPHSNTIPLMVIKSNGNVGIGGGSATNPATALQVNGTVTASAFSGSFSGTGAGLTGLNGANVSGVAYTNSANTFFAQQTFKISAFDYGCLMTDGTNTLGSYIGEGQCSFGTLTSHALGFFVNNGSDSMDINTNGYVGIGTIAPAGHLSVVTANGTVNIMDGPFTPELVMTGGGAPGDLRLRNTLEVWPNTNATAAGKVDVRGTNGVADITLDGSNGNVTCVAVNITSDRNAKEDFAPINARDVLDKVTRMPITEWQYKTQTETRHIGPMAQDFHDAFTLGQDDKHISVVDEGGVALAAIQGLNEKLDEKDARIQELEKSVADLKALVEKVAAQNNGGDK